MALRLLQRRYSTFFSRNSSTIGAPIQESISKFCLPISASQSRFYSNNRESDDQGRRFYFKNREYHDDQRYWFRNPKRVRFTLIFLSCGILLGVSSGKWITVPYSERRHFVLFHKFLPKILSDKIASYEAKAQLPPFNPDTLTAQRIFRQIIHQASQIQKQDEEEIGIKSEKFQIIVFDSPRIRAVSCGGSGKIYVTSGMLRHYRRHEPMIATIFSHEIGHTLAAHYPELISKFVCLMSGIGMSFYLFTKSAYVRSKCFYPVPSGEERIEILKQPRIINEAVSRHRKGTQPPVKDCG